MITQVSAVAQGIQSVDFSNFESVETIDLSGNTLGYESSLGIDSLVSIDLSDNAMSSIEVDAYLGLFASIGLSSAYINLAGTNAVRTVASDIAVDTLIGLDNIICVNQSMAGTTIIGQDSITGAAASGNTTLGLIPFVCTQTATIATFDAYVINSGTLKVGIFEDNGGTPGNAVSFSNDNNPVTGGQWNRISIPAANVTLGQTYWLCGHGSASGTKSYVAGSDGAYVSSSYVGWSFTDPFSGGTVVPTAANYLFRIRI